MRRFFGGLIPVLVAFAVLAACATPPPALPTPAPSDPPVRNYWPTAAWRMAAPAERGLDEAKLAGLRAEIERDLPFLDSLLIIKDGDLVYEEYFNGYDASRLHHVASVTKSFMSALVGMAHGRGAIPSIDATLGRELRDHFAGFLKRGQGDISLRHLLQMRSGLSFDEGKFYEEVAASAPDGVLDPLKELEWFTARNLTEYALSYDSAHRPGTAWAYSTVDSQLLSASFSALTGQSLEQYARQELFPALGITNWRWPEDATGVTLGGIGLELAPRDMAKLGFLYLNRGAWDGEELVPADWVRQSTAPQDSGLYRWNGQTLPIEWYGMQWWNWRPDLFGGQRAVAAHGYGGQNVMILPDLDMIVVTTANDVVAPDVAEVQGNHVYDLVKYSVLPAVVEQGRADPFWATPAAPPTPSQALYTAGADGRDRALLLDDPEFQLWGPAWSPDGGAIAFSRAIPVVVSPGSNPSPLYISGADGKNLRQLTDNGRNNYLAAWSPDGSRIAYISGGQGGIDSHEIYVINADGAGDTRLTDNDAQEYGVSWSPDGSKLAFGTKREGEWRIYTMNPDGSDAQPLPTPADGNSPTWSPDGSRIAFMSERNSNADIFLMDADGGNQQLLVGGEAWDYLPQWSPDGARIAFASTRDDAEAIYTVSVDGSDVRKVSGRGLIANVASWSPDGTRLVFHGAETGGGGLLGLFGR
jgi:CubicO group peptidase (beta-lactamase class C family)/sugar lactone lactonase YvrE